MTPKTVQLFLVGNTPLSMAKELEEPLRSQLGVNTLLAKVQLQTPTYAFNKDRNQYHSNAIMRRLVPMLEPTANCGLGVLDVDLFVPDTPFVFGEADREARIALVSTFRLKQGATAEVLKRRLEVEAIHETGHLLGLSYCDDARCVMFLATAPQDVDRKGNSLCNICRNELTKLNR